MSYYDRFMTCALVLYTAAIIYALGFPDLDKVYGGAMWGAGLGFYISGCMIRNAERVNRG